MIHSTVQTISTKWMENTAFHANNALFLIMLIQIYILVDHLALSKSIAIQIHQLASTVAILINTLVLL